MIGKEIPLFHNKQRCNFSHRKTNEPKSSSFHKLVQSQCGDDNVQSGNGQNIIRVDPCLKLFVGCPIMVSVGEFHSQSFKIVKKYNFDCRFFDRHHVLIVGFRPSDKLCM